MTVAELIEALSKLPQDLPVYAHDWSDTNPIEPENVRVLDEGRDNPFGFDIVILN